ncbi:MAG: fructosamine kinase family protein [Bacteroidota bacterium]|nr:fructosamine kinase family protein [Bacteroidota bacterium]
MLDADFTIHLNQSFSFSIKQASPLSGGDINAVFLLTTDQGNFVIKINDAQRFPEMFSLEKLGLESLAQSKSFIILEVLGVGTFETKSYLLLEHIESGKPSVDFDEIFANNLAKMHQTTSAFGFQKDNYIGSLPQYNTEEASAADFYIKQRLMPQFKMAADRGYTFEDVDLLYKSIPDLIPDEPAALIHGDLWGGNFMVNSDGNPVLIDPATCYAPREMDLAMMRLFGGFNENIFITYHEVFPLCEGWKARIKLWQLYYILVHVNLFGAHYYNTANSILKTYL